jgi:hypothetical protein
MHNIKLTDQELFYITKAIYNYLEEAESKDELHEDDLLNMVSVIDKIREVSENLVLDEPGILN